MTIPFDELRTRLLANPAVRSEYDALAAESEVSTELVRARVRAGLSQAELAKRMGVTESLVVRMESGRTLTSTKTLLRLAEATRSRLHITLPGA